MAGRGDESTQVIASRRHIAFLTFDDCMLPHISGPMSTFERAGRFDRPVYALQAVSRSGGMIRTSCGLRLDSCAIDQAPPPDILFLAGGFGTIEAEKDSYLLDYIRMQATRAIDIAAISSGTSLLARTGLLDGRRATTHWSQQTEMARLHPTIQIMHDAQICQDGRYWTCSSSAGGIEIARRMIEVDFGASAARRATRDLIVTDRRMFAASRENDGHARYEELLQWARTNLRQPLTIGDLAVRCGLTERHFLADFVSHMGETPAKAIERLRVEAATLLIETSDMTLTEIAAAAGFRQSERMRRAFMRGFGQSPQAMREALGARNRRRS